MEKVGRIKDALIDFQLIDQYEVQPNGETNMTKYLQLLNAFRGARYVYCEARFFESNEDEKTSCQFDYNSSGRLYTTYVTYDNDFHGPDNADLDLPDKASSIIGLEIFDDLKIVIWQYHADFVYESLKYSFINCPKLQSFRLYYIESHHEGRVSAIGYMHERKDPMGSDQSNYTIDVLKMEYISPLQHHFDLVATYLKDIAVIWFTTIQWDYLRDDQVINFNGV
ncbi:hypothetical protein MFLAVUS_010756 [Mucor flavus]|uniref:Uncharacterized protein n=1 Tax=Mucor flavus TaxID=439312 RepID=A0ABP9ZDK6_9FUNG